jgi:hypothetical protein
VQDGTESGAALHVYFEDDSTCAERLRYL